MAQRGNKYIKSYSISGVAKNSLDTAWKYSVQNDLNMSKSEIVDAAIVSFCCDTTNLQSLHQTIKKHKLNEEE